MIDASANSLEAPGSDIHRCRFLNSFPVRRAPVSLPPGFIKSLWLAPVRPARPLPKIMLGKKILKSLDGMATAVNAGKPLRQSIVRKMVVKGKIVFVRETFFAPLKPRNA